MGFHVLNSSGYIGLSRPKEKLNGNSEEGTGEILELPQMDFKKGKEDKNFDRPAVENDESDILELPVMHFPPPREK